MISQAPVSLATTLPPPVIKPLSGTICFELRKASGAIAAAMLAEFGRWKLKPSEATLLSFIGANPGCRQSGIARAFRARPANLVSLIARLEREGLLCRAPGPGRAIALSVSAAGALLLREVDLGFDRLETAITRDLDPTQREAVVQALGLICQAACHYGREL